MITDVIWQANVAAFLARVVLKQRDLVKTGEIEKALRIEILLNQWQICRARHTLKKMQNNTHD